MAMIAQYQILFLILALTSPIVLAKEAEQQLILGQVGQGKVQQQAFSLLQQAYQQLGISITTQSYPSKRSLAMSNRGDIDGELLRINNITTQYPNLIAVPVTLYQVKNAAFTINGIAEFKNIKDILQYPIAIRRGILWQERFIHGHTNHVIKAQETNQQVELLNIGRVKYIIASVIDISQFQSRNSSVQNIRQVSPIIKKTEFIHYLHQKHRHLIPQLTIEIKKIIAAINVQPLTVPTVYCETH